MHGVIGGLQREVARNVDPTGDRDRVADECHRNGGRASNEGGDARVQHKHRLARPRAYHALRLRLQVLAEWAGRIHVTADFTCMRARGSTT